MTTHRRDDAKDSAPEADDSYVEPGTLQTVLVVDDDEVARNLLANYFRRMGLYDIDLREDGEGAWEAIRSKRYDFVVLDWKLPGLSGLALFNRIRSRKDYRNVPLLIVSGFLDKNDFRLLQEYPGTGLMEKPFTNGLFDNKVEALRRETVWNAQNVTLVDALLVAVDRDESKAETLLKQLLKKAPNPIPLALLASRRLIKTGLLKSAEKVLRGILKVDDGCLMAMNELGKVLHLQGRHKQALECLRQAHRVSPQNLQRLCLLGEVELNLQDPDSARAYFQQALAIDEESATARAGLVVADNLSELQGGLSAAQVTASFASLMNTMGIALVRNGLFQRGIDQYRAAMAFVHARDDSARVAFNLGLGYLRWGKPDEALPWFRRSEAMATDGFAKSARYVTRLVAATGPGGGLSRTERAQVDDLGFVPLAGDEADADAATVTDDQERRRSVSELAGDAEGAQVIPFPGADTPAPPTRGEELLEETVGGGGQMTAKFGELAAAKVAAAASGFEEVDRMGDDVDMDAELVEL